MATRDSLASTAPEAGYALRFVSGKYQGGTVPLRDGRDVVVGRSNHVDLVLADDMVSRKHARISVRGGEVTIQDLGSTNGVFVNGEKVKKARLREGDRILIGASILKLVAAEPGSNERTDAQIRQALEAAAAQVPSEGVAMRGRLEEVPLPDLLQLLATSKKSGALSLRSGEARAAVHLREGQVVACAIEGRPQLAPRKAFSRIVGWAGGTFELLPPDASVAAALDEPLEALLLEGMQHIDEMRRLEAPPPPDGRLALAAPLRAPLRALGPEELDLVQLALEHGVVSQVVDRAAFPDAKALWLLEALVARGYLALS
jgi:pSer/pThr/pTyr-binding forkhead associated (FHA) protein